MKKIFIFLSWALFSALFWYIAYHAKPLEVRFVDKYTTIKEDCTQDQLYESALEDTLKMLKTFKPMEVQYLLSEHTPADILTTIKN
jgi:hypothetical protein